MRRLRGGTLREPLLVRLFGGTQLDAVMTGAEGAGEASMLFPACRRSTAETVLAEFDRATDAVSGKLPSRAGRDAQALDSMRACASAVTAVHPCSSALCQPGRGWHQHAHRLLCAACPRPVAIAGAPGGRQVGWLARTGSLQRRHDCIATPGIIRWTVRHDADATAGRGGHADRRHRGRRRALCVINIPAEAAWTIAADASPWVADSKSAVDFG